MQPSRSMATWAAASTWRSTCTLQGPISTSPTNTASARRAREAQTPGRTGTASYARPRSARPTARRPMSSLACNARAATATRSVGWKTRRTPCARTTRPFASGTTKSLRPATDDATLATVTSCSCTRRSTRGIQAGVCPGISTDLRCDAPRRRRSLGCESAYIVYYCISSHYFQGSQTPA
ncbi:hypothetical protein T492DRAFT_908313 [Pavlovales sp. CCMP2436]|nr:hypothetical protein T492DRAFT_908313 [Pavlovales sp. CCMP2436]